MESVRPAACLSESAKIRMLNHAAIHMRVNTVHDGPSLKLLSDLNQNLPTRIILYILTRNIVLA